MEEIMEKIKKLGLSEYEAKVYLTLLEYGRLDAKLIADKSGVPKTAVYPNLSSLGHKNLVQQFRGKVSCYEALAPSMAIPALIERQKKELDNLKEETTMVLEGMLHQKQIFPEKEVLTVSLGKEASGAIYKNTLGRAKKSFYVLGWHFVKAKDKYTFLRDFKKVMDKGVEIRIILTGPLHKDKELIDAYKQAGIGIRYAPLDNFSLLIVDEKECKITLKNKEYTQKFNIFVKDEALAQALQSYYLSTWEKAQRI